MVTDDQSSEGHETYIHVTSIMTPKETDDEDIEKYIVVSTDHSSIPTMKVKMVVDPVDNHVLGLLILRVVLTSPQ